MLPSGKTSQPLGLGAGLQYRQLESVASATVSGSIDHCRAPISISEPSLYGQTTEVYAGAKVSATSK